MNGHYLADSSGQQSSLQNEHHKFSSKHLLVVIGSSVILGLKFSSALLIQLLSIFNSVVFILFSSSDLLYWLSYGMKNYLI